MIAHAMLVIHAALAVLALVAFVGMFIEERRRRRQLARFANALSPESQLWIETLARGMGGAEPAPQDGDALDAWGRDLALVCGHLSQACERIERVALPGLVPTVQALRCMARTLEVLPPPGPLAQAALTLWRTQGASAVLRLGVWMAGTSLERLRARLWFVRRAGRTAWRAALGVPLVSKGGFSRRWYPTIEAALDGLTLAPRATPVTSESILAAFAAWQDCRTAA